ncbi:hypothetical protein L198_00979 [Cryptococcus wingfieldii CBS 7118]|uniref:FAD dependent oxidoreductase domain-containing protein n=1 Tax=Cryptococcus wingfieldii CBS 7118 TaxID=1295528 RepID=A0A1E3K2P0_9TREE|nr:hypothetical protein L198_00979 [Cryptococcus wingfieldii CBS 7118]ODO07400.1 hypothetical protein L198_00979 [Cryptococcus wingfieldii CBS 7118]
MTSTTTSTPPGPLASKSSKLIIVGGGGTMGSSTALHLARRGYTDITIMDIASADDVDGFAGCTAMCWDAWTTDPLFKPFAHEVGKVFSLSKGRMRSLNTKNKYKRMSDLGREDIKRLDNVDEVRKAAPHLAKADIAAFTCTRGGWVAAPDALDAVGRELQKVGVKAIFGSSGTFDSLTLGNDDETVKGVRAKDGSVVEADLVVVATGAWTPALIDLEGQCVSKCWCFAHIQLTPEEAAELKVIPTVYSSVYGFFFEPRPDNHLLKLVNEFPGYTNFQSCQPFGSSTVQRISVPRSHADHPDDTMPQPCLEEIERLVQKTLPHLWLICEHPKWKGVVVAPGDSGRTFNMLPVVGGQIADLIEDKLSDERRHAWRWRPGAGDPKGKGRPGPRALNLSEVETTWQQD